MLLVLLLAAFADTATDRADIERVVVAVTGDPKQVAGLFTADAYSELDRLRDLNQGMLNASGAVWSETMPPRMIVASVRFITPDVAQVDAANTQVGTVLVRRIPVLLILRKEGTYWRIAFLRVTDRPVPR